MDGGGYLVSTRTVVKPARSCRPAIETVLPLSDTIFSHVEPNYEKVISVFILFCNLSRMPFHSMGAGN